MFQVWGLASKLKAAYLGIGPQKQKPHFKSSGADFRLLPPAHAENQNDSQARPKNSGEKIFLNLQSGVFQLTIEREDQAVLINFSIAFLLGEGKKAQRHKWEPDTEE